MTEGTLSRWLKKEGENVRAGDVIAEIETDKATMEVEAVDEGVLGKILVADGTEGVKVNEPIAILVEQGEAVPARRAPAPSTAPPPQRPGASAPRPRQAAKPAPRQPDRSPRRAPRGNGHDAGGERIFASPLARRMAKQAGHRSDSAEGQRAERPHRQGGHRGGAEAARRAPPAAAGSAATPAAAAAPRGRQRRSPRRTSWCRIARSAR